MGAIWNDNKERLSLLLNNLITVFKELLGESMDGLGGDTGTSKFFNMCRILANIATHGGHYSCPSGIIGKRDIFGMTIRRE